MFDDVVQDLLAGCAILDGEGLTTAFGHLSARGPDDVALISGSDGPGLVHDASALLTTDLDGNVLGGDPTRLPGEVAIHLRILAARRDVGSVCRFHGPACMAWSTLGRPLPATIGMGLFLGSEVPWFDTTTTVRTAEHGDLLAAALGDRNAVLLRGFGAVTVGATVAESVVRAWMLERAADAVVTASAVGPPLAFPAGAAQALADPGGPAPAQLRRAWNYLRDRWAPTTTREVVRA
jgi:ribulose-5-phosphate 4-epimerase/fuculose-1-phosphate aldolase